MRYGRYCNLFKVGEVLIGYGLEVPVDEQEMKNEPRLARL